MGALPKEPGKTLPSSSVPTWPTSSVALRNPVNKGPLGGGREGNGEWGFLSYLKNRKEMMC